MRESQEMVARLYTEHYDGLVRLATLMLRDVRSAEEVVQDAFVATYVSWWRLRDPTRATPYLRRAVVNGCRSALRRRRIQQRHAEAESTASSPSAEVEGMAMIGRRDLLNAIADLPRRQREVLILRYYLDLSESDIAETLTISRGSVKTHASRAIAALRLHPEVATP